MTGLPSKFQIGNTLLAGLTFFLMGTPFYILSLDSIYTQIWGAFSFLASYGLHRYRAKQHNAPKSTADALYRVEMNQNKIISQYEEIILQLQIQNAKR